MKLLRNSRMGVVACTLAASVGVGLCSEAPANARSVKGHAAALSITSFTNNFVAMKQLAPIVKKGSGKIAAILPDTTSSTRYVEFDQPDLLKAAKMAGIPAGDMIVQNGNGSDTQFLSDVKADITHGAKVLLIDPEDSGTGVAVEKYAAAHGVKVINYDRLVLGGPADPYVSFNNVRVGQLIGQGFVQCVKAWHIGHPYVIEMHGAPTDNNATLFTEGYNSVLDPLFRSHKFTLVANTAGTWNPTSPAPDALDEFKAAFTAHKNANSAVIPNDENGAPIITYLKSLGVKPYKFPTTGQDATLTGLQNILSGYQCGTVYKPIYKEAEAAVALAVYLRAGMKPPKSLENGYTVDPMNHKRVPSVLLQPTWVTPQNMKDTVVKDKFVPLTGPNGLCSGTYAPDCRRYGIKF